MKAIKFGTIVVFILLFFSSCENMAGVAHKCADIAGVVHKCENIEDEQTRELLQRYFDDNERAFILEHFKNYGGRYLLGETYTNENSISCIRIYEDAIKDYADEIDYPFEFVRGDVIIHELCHALFPYENHSDKWLSTYKQKLEIYCAESKDYLAEYYGYTSCGIVIDMLVEYYIYLSTSDYEQESEE